MQAGHPCVSTMSASDFTDSRRGAPCTQAAHPCVSTMSVSDFTCWGLPTKPPTHVCACACAASGRRMSCASSDFLGACVARKGCRHLQTQRARATGSRQDDDCCTSGACAGPIAVGAPRNRCLRLAACGGCWRHYYIRASCCLLSHEQTACQSAIV